MKKSLQNVISSISNGQKHRFSEISVIKSFQIIKFLKCLYKEGFIRGFIIKDKTLVVYLKYYNGRPVIKSIDSVSKIGNRFYISNKKLLQLIHNKSCFILLTKKGFSSIRGVFSNKFIGGEIVCNIL